VIYLSAYWRIVEMHQGLVTSDPTAQTIHLLSRED
jgi:hypothetical protein